MENIFDRNLSKETMTVKVGENFFRGDEVVAYFDEVLSGLLSKEKSIVNKAQFANMARILIQKREYRKASGVIYQALSRYPGDPDFLDQKVDIFIFLKDYYKALDIVNEALEINPYDVNLLLKKAKIFSINRNYDEEEQAYHDIQSMPRNDFVTNKGKTLALRRLCDLYIKLKRYDHAEKIIEKIIRKQPNESNWAMYFSILSLSGKKEKSEEMKEVFSRFQKAQKFFDKGAEFEMAGKFNLALSNYRKGLELYDEEPLVNMKVASILMYRKKWFSKAEEYLRKAIEVDPEQATFRSNLVICLKRQGKLEEAFEEAKTAESQDLLSNIHHLRKLSIDMGREDEFEKIILESIEKDGKGLLPVLRFEMANHYNRNNNREKAEEWYKKSIELYLARAAGFPEDWEIHLDLGHCYKNLKMYKKAEEAYKIAEQIEGADLEEIYESLVSLYQKMHERRKTSVYLKKLINLNPKRVVNYIDLGINYMSRISSLMRKKSDK